VAKTIRKTFTMTFSVMVLVAVFSLLTNPAKEAQASESGVGDFKKVVQDSIVAGAKTGASLIESRVAQEQVPGRFYFNSNEMSNPIAKDVLILLDEADKINTQEDLESFIAGDRDSTKPMMLYTEPINGVATVLAVWTLSNEEFNAHLSGGAYIFPGAPQFFKDILAKNGYRLYNATTRNFGVWYN
jgi:hypothetical protein